MENNFIDELIKESEERDRKLEQSHLDLILIEIRKLEEQIEKNFRYCCQEREIIKNWALERNSSLVNARIEWLSKKLELFLREENVKTLDLPNGIIRMRKQPEKVIVVDEEKFFKKATTDLLLNIIPEAGKTRLIKDKSLDKKNR